MEKSHKVLIILLILLYLYIDIPQVKTTKQFKHHSYECPPKMRITDNYFTLFQSAK